MKRRAGDEARTRTRHAGRSRHPNDNRMEARTEKIHAQPAPLSRSHPQITTGHFARFNYINPKIPLKYEIP